MTATAAVNLWGRTIGAVALESGQVHAAFQYDADFANSGIEVAPLAMPLSDRIYRFPELGYESFYGLPGLLSDSIPDKFGNRLIDAWLAQQGREPDSFNAIERLRYVGTRGMGALEFSPLLRETPRARVARPLNVDHLVELASAVLSSHANLHTSFADDQRAGALTDILRVGTSAGGARAKAIIAWNPTSNEVRSGQVAADQGFEHWLLKFDGVSGNKDRELEDPRGYGLIEYAYFHMARDCGIEISDCRMLTEHGRHHFMTRRFDRTATGGKLHMQSLGALAHYDFNATPGSYSYEQALLAIRKLGLPMAAIEQQFRRMVFNLVGRNQDDHVKNIAFLMDQAGRWSLAPAYDMTYAYNPQGKWTGSHQMSVNGKQDDFTLADLEACANTVSLQRGRTKQMLDEVCTVFSRWDDYAKDAGVAESWRKQIGKVLRLQGW